MFKPICKRRGMQPHLGFFSFAKTCIPPFGFKKIRGMLLLSDYAR